VSPQGEKFLRPLCRRQAPSPLRLWPCGTNVSFFRGTASGYAQKAWRLSAAARPVAGRTRLWLVQVLPHGRYARPCACVRPRMPVLWESHEAPAPCRRNRSALRRRGRSSPPAPTSGGSFLYGLLSGGRLGAARHRPPTHLDWIARGEGGRRIGNVLDTVYVIGSHHQPPHIHRDCGPSLRSAALRCAPLRYVSGRDPRTVAACPRLDAPSPYAEASGDRAGENPTTPRQGACRRASVTCPAATPKNGKGRAACAAPRLANPRPVRGIAHLGGTRPATAATRGD